jgi:predicted protein tyrosine phosphatase
VIQSPACETPANATTANGSTSCLLADHAALLLHKPLHVLDIPDDYGYMDPELVDLLGDPVADLLGLVR